jgi:hypothetical protein
MASNWLAARSKKGLACRIPEWEKVVVFPFESVDSQPGSPASTLDLAGSLLATKTTEKLQQE